MKSSTQNESETWLKWNHAVRFECTPHDAAYISYNICRANFAELKFLFYTLENYYYFFFFDTYIINLRFKILWYAAAGRNIYENNFHINFMSLNRTRNVQTLIRSTVRVLYDQHESPQPAYCEYIFV